MKSREAKPQQEELQRMLRPRHIMMIALGGAIGAGMFKGLGTSIAQAGPSVIVAYLLGGLILFFVMQGLAEMAVSNPRARTFRELVEPLLGGFSGHFIGWLYWLDWELVMAAETAASAVFLQYWFPTVSLWVLALCVSVAVTLLNLFSVKVYGETEYWLAGVKILVLVVFVVLGFVFIAGGKGAVQPAISHTPGGWFPHGLTGFAASMLVVMFSFGGTEMIGMTLGEVQQPEKMIPRAAKGVMIRIILFYILPIIAMMGLLNWTQISGSVNPFVTVFEAVGLPKVASLMNFVMLTAVLSATNTGMYATSRMLFTQAQDGEAPKFFAKLSRKKVPVRALLASSLFLYGGVIVAVFAKGQAFNYLMVIPGYSVLLVWLLLAAAHVRSRYSSSSVSLGPKQPVGSWFSLVMLLLILIGIIATSPVYGTLLAVLAVVFVVLGYRPWRLDKSRHGNMPS